MLNHNGKLIGDFTVANLTPTGDVESYSAGPRPAGRTACRSARSASWSSAPASPSTTHERWFLEQLPGDGSVRLDVHGRSVCGLSIAGPRARDVLAKLVDDDVSNEAWPFLDIREAWVDMIPCVVGRVTFTGDLGYEIWMEAAAQPYVFDRLVEAGAEFDLGLFGSRALDSLRLEKNFGAWATEYRPIYDPYEAGLGWAVKVGKGDFIGRDAAAAREGGGPARRLVFFRVDADMGPDGADVIGDEPVWRRRVGAEEVVGWVTSGGYAHASDASIAMGYVRREFARAGSGFEIEILGVRRPATRLDEPIFDPSGARMRG